MSHRRPWVRKKSDFLARIRPPPQPLPGNVLSRYLEKHWRTRKNHDEAMKWLHRHHPDLVKGAVLAREVDGRKAPEALRVLIEAIKRWREKGPPE